ncbi:MAG: hypothetical protein Q8P18_32870 [Pseudomonadota bacterium]|nr:hypothetical protein [Pseudomonadota bacterium]
MFVLSILACQPSPSDADVDAGGDTGPDTRPDPRPDDTARAEDVFPTSRQAVEWPFSTRSPWNMPLGDAAALSVTDDPCTVSLRSRGYTPWINAEKWSHPIFLSSEGDPAREIWADEELAATAPVPEAATPALPEWPDTDAHMHIIDPLGQYVDEMWKARRRDDGGWDVDSWARVDLYGEGVGTGGVRVYGGSAIAGLIRVGEVEAGIHHALSLALALDLLAPVWVWPASELSTTREDDYLGAVATGQLVALPPGFDIGAQGWSEEGEAVARALQHYGAYVTDHASGFALYAAPEAEADVDPARDDLADIRSHLRCVTDNTQATPGGAGARLAPLAPELEGAGTEG